ncbi:beta strand repeat-containing protein [Cerasicoccus fimbriatus]|uniref:beta strand repeat-containing protein n=1 Tax=Cerasicoccus fimbriatus TaxID=3014554 RepID=UPI0022B3F11B|nr:PEP-CTERM sorting domain-containing protein [Cerasicoccus sp. TK19100]
MLSKPTSTALIISSLTLPLAHAQFAPGPNPINGASSSPQTLSSGTGEITSSGVLTVSGSSVAVTVTGDSTLINGNFLLQNGTGRAVRINTLPNTFNLVNHSGAFIQTSDADAIQWNAGTGNPSIDLDNAGTITTLGSGQAIDFDSYIGTNFDLNNMVGGTIDASGNVAVLVGGGGQILNNGVIRSQADRAIEAGGTMTINNFGNIESTNGDTIRVGDNSFVINQSGAYIQATAVVNGTELQSDDGISLGEATGVTVTNSGTIQGRHGVTGGADTYTIEVNNEVGGLITGLNGSGVNIDGLTTTSGATVTNRGTIEGRVSSLSGVTTGDGDGVDVDGVLNLTNYGTIAGLGADGNDSGGNPNNAEGVAAGGGIIHNMEGGDIYGQAATGNLSREGRGILIDDGMGGSGVATTTINNAGSIRGVSSYAIKFVGEFDDEIANSATGTIQGNGVGTGGAIQTGGGNDTINNYGTIQGNNGIAIQTEGGNDTVNLIGGSVTGNIDGGTGTDSIDLSSGINEPLTYAGIISNFESSEISGGVVIINGEDQSTLTTVLADATLGGNGQFAALTLNSGATLSPGNSPGTIQVAGDLNFDADTQFDFELGTSSDLVDIEGSMVFAGGPITSAVLNISDSGGLTETTYTLFEFGSSSGFDEDNFIFGDVPDGFEGFLTLNATSLDLTVTQVPEPETIWFLAMTGLALVWMRRRRQQS